MFRIAIILATLVATIFSGVAVASAATTAPGQTGVPPAVSCNAYHGAFGQLGFAYLQAEANDGNLLPNGTVAPSAGSQFGTEQGVITGQTNSGASAACNS